MMVVWTGADLLEMMLLYFYKHIQKIKYFPLQKPARQDIAVLFQQAPKSLGDTKVAGYTQF